MNDIDKYVGPALAVILVPVLLGWILRRVNPAARNQSGVAWLEYGAMMKACALFSVSIAVAMTVVWLNVAHKDKSAVLCIAVLFGGLSLPLVVEFFFVRIGFDSGKIYCHSGWRRNRIVEWESVESVHFSQSMQWWIVRTKKAGKIRAHLYLSGLSEFLAELQKRGIPIAQSSGTGNSGASFRRA